MNIREQLHNRTEQLVGVWGSDIPLVAWLLRVTEDVNQLEIAELVKQGKLNGEGNENPMAVFGTDSVVEPGFYKTPRGNVVEVENYVF